MVTLTPQHGSPQGASLYPVFPAPRRPDTCRGPWGGCGSPEGCRVFEERGCLELVAGDMARTAKNASLGGQGWEEVRSGEQWEDLKGEVTGGKGWVPGLHARLCRTRLLPQVGLGGGLVEGNLFLQGGASGRDVPGQGTWFLPVPALRIPVQASPPLPSDFISPSISECSLCRSLHRSGLAPSFRRFLGCPCC